MIKGKKENSNLQKASKNIKKCSFEKFKNASSQIKLTYQNSPQNKLIKGNGKINQNKFHFNKRTKLNSNINIIINSNIKTNAFSKNQKLHKNRTYSKYNLNKKVNNSKFTNSPNIRNCNSYVNIKNLGNRLISSIIKHQKKIYNKELNNSNIQNNISLFIEQNNCNNNINSCYETNNSSDNNNHNKENNEYFSLNKNKSSLKKINISQSNSLNNTVSNSNGKNSNSKLDKFKYKNLLFDYQVKNGKYINKNMINNNNASYNKSIKIHNSTYNNFNINNSKKKSKTKVNILMNDSNLTPYNNKNNKNYLVKPIIKNLSPGKRPFIISNSHSKLFKKEKIDIQVTSINNILNNKFSKEINSIQNEMDKNIKLNQANSKYKKYSTLNQFFDKFLKKLNEYLNKTAFNCLNHFLQKIFGGYHEIISSLSLENKNIQKQNIQLNQKIEEFQKKLKDSEKKIKLLQKENLELKVEKKNEIKDNINNSKNDLNNLKKKENYENDEQNIKVFKLNEQNLNDLDALYFFDKVNMKIKRSYSKRIPLIPIEEDSEGNNKRKKTFSKKINDINNNNFIKIKKAFE